MAAQWQRSHRRERAIACRVLVAITAASAALVIWAANFACAPPTRAGRRAHLRTLSRMPSTERVSSLARAAEARPSGGDTDEIQASSDDLDGKMAKLQDAEIGDGLDALSMARDDEVAKKIVEETLSETYLNDAVKAPQSEVDQIAKAKSRRAAAAAIRESELKVAMQQEPTPVCDLYSLVNKHGGPSELIKNHELCFQEGLLPPETIEQFKVWINDYVIPHMKPEQFVQEYEHESGSRLIMVGIVHTSTRSQNIVTKLMREMRPQCVVLERRMGDDGLQRLACAEQTFLEMVMTTPPSVLLPSDDFKEKVQKFSQDRLWMDTLGFFKEIGGRAAAGLEMSVALKEFVRQRMDPGTTGTDWGPRGGTVVFADLDMRRAGLSGGFVTSALLSMTSPDTFMPLRDLQMASSIRGAMQTHKTIVAIVGQAHLGGIGHLLEQDPKIKLVKSGPKFTGLSKVLGKWVRMDRGDLQQAFTNEAVGNSGFRELAEFFEEHPYGTYMDFEAAKELYQYRKKMRAELKEKGVENAALVVPSSADIAASLYGRGHMVTPESMDDLQLWLQGGRVEQEAGEFPYATKNR